MVPLKKIYVFSILFCVLVAISNSAWADVIRRIEVEGAQRIEEKTILSYLTVKTGDEFNASSIDSSLKSLYATGLFADVQMAQDVRTLRVKVVENPIVNQVAFEGNVRIEDHKLAPEIQLRGRSVFTRAKAQSDVARIQEVYRRSGRFGVKLEPKIIELDQNRVDVVFEIDEGPETKVKRITFVNNKEFSDKDLRDAIVTSEERWYKFLTASDTYDPDRLEFDKELLRRFYLARGYADFSVLSAIAELSQDKEGFFLTFTVNEGPRYRFGDISVVNRLEGVAVSGLDEFVFVEPGEWFDDRLVDESSEALTKAVEAQLLPFVRVRSDVDIDRENKRVNIAFLIEEGAPLYIDEINVEGNVRTLDRVIRRELAVVEGDPFNNDRIQKSEQKVRELGYFEKVKFDVKPGDAPDRRDIDIKVVEQSTGELSIGAGFSTADGPLADFKIKERNFLGRGQELGLALALAGERSEIDLSFAEPYFLGRDLRFSTDVFHVSRDLQEESSYDLVRTGFGLNLGYPLSRRLRHSLGYRIVNNNIENVKSTASNYISQQEGERVTSAISQTLFYDARNSRVTPTQGYTLRLFNELAGLGGDAHFFNSEVQGSYYYPVAEDVIFNLTGKTGAIFAYNDDEVAINDRYFLGDSSFRGFAQAGMGPRDLSSDDSLGGTKYYTVSAELSFPMGLPEEFGIKGHLFSDAGSLWDTPDTNTVSLADDSSLRVSAGFGVSWDSPLGPIRVNFATPLVDEDYDQDQVFNLAFGTRF